MKRPFLTPPLPLLLLVLISAGHLKSAAVDYNGNPINRSGGITLTPQTSSALLASYTQSINLAGLLDNTFGSLGRVLTPIGNGNDAEGYAVALQPNGSIVVAGLAHDGGVNSYKFAVARYTSQGILDPTFGAGAGYVLTPLGDGDDAQGSAVALQPDGKIVVAGFAFDDDAFKFAVARYTSNGALDPTFGAGIGYVITPVGTLAEARAVAIQPNDNIVIAGLAVDGGVTKFAVARYTPQGILDPTFGAGTGYVLTPLGDGSDAEGYAVALQQNGNIVVAGLAADGGVNSYKFAVARYTSQGILDPTFGAGAGYVLTPLGDGDYAKCYGVTLQPNGNIVVAGVAVDGGVDKFAVARYTPQGILDPTFGAGAGYVLTPIGGGGDAQGRAVALESNGNLVVAGYAIDGGVNNYKFAVARYTSQGILDPTFGAGTGYVLTPIGSDGNAKSYAIALQHNGTIVVAGLVADNNAFKFAVARYISQGILDPTFGVGAGYVLTPIGDGNDAEGYAVVLQQNGNIVVAGLAADNNTFKFTVARYINPFTLTSFTESYGSVGLL